MDRKDSIVCFVGGWDLDSSETCFADDDALPGAFSVPSTARDHIAIGTGGKAGFEVPVELNAVQIERDESLRSATERHLLVSVVPPVGQGRSCDGVPEADHVEDLAPTMLADPSVAAGIVRVDLW